MPVTASLIGGGVSLLGGAIKGLVGAGQKSKGHKLLNSLQYPNEEIPNEIREGAAKGLPSEQYNQAMQNIQRQQLVALRGSQDRRGGLMALPSIQQATNDATLNLDAKNAATRQQNQFRLASWKDKVWQNNIKDKYNRDYNYGMGLVGMGNANLVGGIDEAIGGVGKAAYGLYGNGGGGSGDWSTGNGNGSTYMKRY